MFQVFGRIVLAQRFEVLASGDALCQLPHVFAIEYLAELGLSDQDNLEKFLLWCLEIGQQPDLLEDISRQVLCFIDNQCRAPASGVRIQKMGT